MAGRTANAPAHQEPYSRRSVSPGGVFAARLVHHRPARCGAVKKRKPGLALGTAGSDNALDSVTASPHRSRPPVGRIAPAGSAMSGRTTQSGALAERPVLNPTRIHLPDRIWAGRQSCRIAQRQNVPRGPTPPSPNVGRRPQRIVAFTDCAQQGFGEGCRGPIRRDHPPRKKLPGRADAVGRLRPSPSLRFPQTVPPRRVRERRQVRPGGR
jgi:hypothetical protein